MEKPTTVKTISGIVQPDTGELLWVGKPVSLEEYGAGGEFGLLPARTITAPALMLGEEGSTDVIRLGHQERG